MLKHSAITGVERYTIELLKAFDKAGFQYDIAFPQFHNRYLQHLWEHTALVSKAKHYDILFCPANIAPLLKPHKTKIITTIHDLSFIYFPDSFSKAFRSYYNFIIPKVLKISDAVIAVSNNEKEQIIKKYPFAADKIYAVQSGIGEEFLNCKIALEKKDYILYVGSLNRRKNFFGLIKAFYRIMNKISYRLVIVGGAYNIFKKDSGIKKILGKIPKNRITFKGYVNSKEELMDLYRRAYLFVFPSFYEGFGFPVLEAMACGVPVITSNTSCLPEICGDAAYYVDPYYTDSISEGIIKMLSDRNLREKLIGLGIARARLFSWEKSAENYLKIFEETAKLG